MNMKKTLVILAVSMMAQVSFAGDFCAQVVETLFDGNDPYNCVQASDRCESDELRAQGWLTSANGKCVQLTVQQILEPQMCGLGGGVMMNPNNPKERVQSLSTCDTDVLKQMGWVGAK